MDQAPRLTPQTIKVLSCLLKGERAGAEIGKETGLASGTLYPILLRLENAGWLDSRWEVESSAALKRPRRRYYKVTGAGAAALRDLLSSLSPTPIGGLAWA